MHASVGRSFERQVWSPRSRPFYKRPLMLLTMSRCLTGVNPPSERAIRWRTVDRMTIYGLLPRAVSYPIWAQSLEDKHDTNWQRLRHVSGKRSQSRCESTGRQTLCNRPHPLQVTRPISFDVQALQSPVRPGYTTCTTYRTWTTGQVFSCLRAADHLDAYKRPSNLREGLYFPLRWASSYRAAASCQLMTFQIALR